MPVKILLPARDHYEEQYSEIRQAFSLFFSIKPVDNFVDSCE
ncbi:hypothetical protein [Ignatzschineria cameli]|nr:hypothetical protein [Ignatzschineria cameli]